MKQISRYWVIGSLRQGISSVDPAIIRSRPSQERGEWAPDVWATRHPNLNLGHPPPSLASEAEDAEGAGGEECQGGRFRYGTGLGSDGEGVAAEVEGSSEE
jgi:hypothetical protein